MIPVSGKLDHGQGHGHLKGSSLVLSYKLVITEHVRLDPPAGTCPVWLKLAS